MQDSPEFGVGVGASGRPPIRMGVGDGRPPLSPSTPELGISRPPLARVTSFERSISRDAVPPMLSTSFGSVVLLEVRKVSRIYLRPWQMSRQWSSSGTGFAIGDKRILTNDHVVKHATDIRLRKHGDSRRWRARVLCAGEDVDLAVVVLHESVDEESAAAFWNGVSPCPWSCELPSLQSSVNVVGYPAGGRTICVTEGVISRIDATHYSLGLVKSPGKLLVIQIDAAINPGNSGGPVFDKLGNVVGVAFQGMRSVGIDNVGYIIPTCIAKNFLAALVSTTGPDGRPRLEYPGLQVRACVLAVCSCCRHRSY